VSAGKAGAGKASTGKAGRQRPRIARTRRPVARSVPAFLRPKLRPVPVTTVRGITVAKRIAGRTARLLRAADRAGLRLGGWGYRSTSRQIQLRRAHCGRSRYALYRMPSGSCGPPTARPGHSMHERGLAIDFYRKGKRGRPRPIAGTREHRWLRRHAHQFGFFNLPGEAWHWSTNGR
jgi:hypothetical protein